MQSQFAPLRRAKNQEERKWGINNEKEKERTVQTWSNSFKGFCESGPCDLFANGELKWHMAGPT